MKLSAVLKFIIVIAVLSTVGYIIYRTRFSPAIRQYPNSTSTEPVVCTMEAKLCSDGSYVGRSGPKCEFATCPTISSSQTETVVVSNVSSISFKYPENLDAKYISLLNYGEFKPQIQLLNKPFTCIEEKFIDNGEKEVKRKIINGRVYCVSRKDDGAAGSTYGDYEYTFAKAEKTVRLSFTLRYTSCGSMGLDSQVIECEKEQSSFDVDLSADQLARSIRLK